MSNKNTPMAIAMRGQNIAFEIAKTTIIANTATAM
jgi:hypothetical protein